MEPDNALDKPDDGPSFSSGSGVGLSANLRKPDTDYSLENSIGIGFSAPSVGFVGLGWRGKGAYELEMHRLSRISPQMTVMSVMAVTVARKPLR